MHKFLKDLFKLLLLNALLESLQLKLSVFSVAQESPRKGKKLCSRWTESDRGRERCTEVLGKAAGQRGRQKLIREAASFTTPQLDRVCVSVCRQNISWA